MSTKTRNELLKENAKLRNTLNEVLSHMPYDSFDWGFVHDMGMVQVSVSKDKLKEWQKIAGYYD